MGFDAYSESKVRLIDDYIGRSLKQYEASVSLRIAPLVHAMRYSLEAPGKRLRPLLALATGEYLGLEAERLLPAACAIEYIHTYSLIHDDLPALDDDDMRRGKPSSHKQFGEDVAILTGDALLTEAFGQMLTLSREYDFPPERVLAAIGVLVQHAGVAGMVGGQYLDVKSNDQVESLPELEFIHIHKTGALILASVLIPAHLTALPTDKLHKLRRYGEAIGLAFQISDDILDSEANIRYSRGPRKKPKPNYTRLTSPSEIRERLNSLIDAAVECIDGESRSAKPLQDIAEFIRIRKK